MRRGVASHGRTVQTDVLHAWEARARGQSLSSRGSMYEPLYFSSNYHQKWPRTYLSLKVTGRGCATCVE
jgi:hypothetical protein